MMRFVVVAASAILLSCNAFVDADDVGPSDPPPNNVTPGNNGIPGNSTSNNGIPNIGPNLIPGNIIPGNNEMTCLDVACGVCGDNDSLTSCDDPRCPTVVETTSCADGTACVANECTDCEGFCQVDEEVCSQDGKSAEFCVIDARGCVDVMVYPCELNDCTGIDGIVGCDMLGKPCDPEGETTYCSDPFTLLACNMSGPGEFVWTVRQDCSETDQICIPDRAECADLEHTY